MLTRWDEWYDSDNRQRDPRIEAAPPSHSVAKAVQAFQSRGIRHVLDLACGIGRDTFTLAQGGLSVTGSDASFNGLQVAQQTVEKRGVTVKWIQADARYLPFQDGAWEGIYCFGLLHEFTSDNKQQDVAQVVNELRRVLYPQGLLVITVLAGDPQAGLPAVQLFSRAMFDETMHGFTVFEIEEFDDTGCTGRPDYHVWYGELEK